MCDDYDREGIIEAFITNAGHNWRVHSTKSEWKTSNG